MTLYLLCFTWQTYKALALMLYREMSPWCFSKKQPQPSMNRQLILELMHLFEPLLVAGAFVSSSAARLCLRRCTLHVNVKAVRAHDLNTLQPAPPVSHTYINFTAQRSRLLLKVVSNVSSTLLDKRADCDRRDGKRRCNKVHVCPPACWRFMVGAQPSLP